MRCASGRCVPNSAPAPPTSAPPRSLDLDAGYGTCMWCDASCIVTSSGYAYGYVSGQKRSQLAAIPKPAQIATPVRPPGWPSLQQCSRGHGGLGAGLGHCSNCCRLPNGGVQPGSPGPSNPCLPWFGAAQAAATTCTTTNAAAPLPHLTSRSRSRCRGAAPLHPLHQLPPNCFPHPCQETARAVNMLTPQHRSFCPVYLSQSPPNILSQRPFPMCFVIARSRRVTHHPSLSPRPLCPFVPPALPV